MSLESLIANRTPVLAEGSVYELLRRSPDVQFDPDLAHAALVFDLPAARVLEATHRAYCDIAAEHQLPIVTFTDTWRANSQRNARSAFADRKVNQANARFLCDIRDSYGPERPDVFVAGLIGCQGDAYRPAEALSTQASIEFHGQQIKDLKSSGVDLLFAATLPALSEAKGMGVVMAETSLPYVLSFVLGPQGTLLDGSSIDRAVEEIDDAARRPPLGYFVNCVHPSAVLQALNTDEATSLHSRFIGFQANTSALCPAELDGIEELQTQRPAPFARQVIQVGKLCRMSVLGGCCGTDTTHIESLARLMTGGEETSRCKPRDGWQIT